MSADPRLSIGRRSASSDQHLTVKAEPRYIAESPTLSVHVARERLANALSAELHVSLTAACALLEEGLPRAEKVSREDRHHVEAAAAIRDLADMLAGLQPAGGSLRRASARRCSALAEEVAAGLVQAPGDLRATVAFLLAHKPDPES